MGAETGWYTLDTAGSALTANTNIIYGIADYAGGAIATVIAPKKETNLEWLDRRVKEMRVAL